MRVIVFLLSALDAFCLRKVVRMVPAREWAGAALVGATDSCGLRSGMDCDDFMPHRQVQMLVCRGAIEIKTYDIDAILA